MFVWYRGDNDDNDNDDDLALRYSGRESQIASILCDS